MKKLFLRKDMLQKVKQYDGNLANVLHTFLVRCLFTTCIIPQLIAYRLN